MSTNGNEAQRELEQKALRNVRGLVDKIEAEDRLGNQKQLVGVVIIAVVVALLAGAFIMGRSKDGERAAKPSIEIPAPTKPVAK